MDFSREIFRVSEERKQAFFMTFQDDSRGIDAEAGARLSKVEADTARIAALEAKVARLDTDTEIVPVNEAPPCEFVQAGETLICDPFAGDAYTIDIVTGITTGPYFQEASDERTRNTP